mmetsp:Transcript_42862/g.99570  ORF Transcript_42862/g.99570 Transcript_42862/m.99570 type:complete len:275 (+) Transcript_42862:22-846(+)
MPKVKGDGDEAMPDAGTKSARRAARRDEQKPYQAAAGAVAAMLDDGDDDGELLVAPSTLEARTRAEHGAEEEEEDGGDKPSFGELSAAEMNGGKSEYRRVQVPAHRFTPLKAHWMEIYEPLVNHMKLQVRMNLKTKSVELRTSEHTDQISALQKGSDFVKAFLMGFDVADAIALLRLDDLYVDTFEVKDVKPLHGDHLSRAIGRIAGKAGKTKFAIENSTRTRIVLADSKIHMLGSFSNIKIARDAICDLILGSPPGKVYTKLRTIASRLKERF